MKKIILLILVAVAMIAVVGCDPLKDVTTVPLKIHADYQRLVILYPNYPDEAGLYGSWPGMGIQHEMTLTEPNFFICDPPQSIDCRLDSLWRKYTVHIEDAKLADLVQKGQGNIWINKVQLEETEKDSYGHDNIWIFYVKNAQAYAHQS